MPRAIAAYQHHVAITQPPQIDHDPGRDFYVTVRREKRTGWLLGPYATHQEAIDNLSRGLKLAIEADPWAAFDAFGTCSLPVGTKVKTVFGNTEQSNAKEAMTMAKKEAVEKKDRVAKLVGKTLKLPIGKTWHRLFEDNIQRMKSKDGPLPRTDAEITAFLQKEFPGRESKVFATVSLVRGRYNREVKAGELGAPKHVSIAYKPEKASKPAKTAKAEKAAPKVPTAKGEAPAASEGEVRKRVKVVKRTPKVEA